MPRFSLATARAADKDTALDILEDGRRAQRACGFVQWADGYPSAETVKADIRSGLAFLLVCGGEAIGYAVLARGDSEYDAHSELWKTRGQYGVIHRMALCDAWRGRGISSRFFSLLEERIAAMGPRAVRIDTGLDNTPMQRALARRGYRLCGFADFVWGPRLAYEKWL